MTKLRGPTSYITHAEEFWYWHMPSPNLQSQTSNIGPDPRFYKEGDEYYDDKIKGFRKLQHGRWMIVDEKRNKRTG